MDAPTFLIARTDADSAKLITSDIDARDREFMTGERTPEGFYRVRSGLEPAVARGLAYAPYADLVWMETSTPELELARGYNEKGMTAYVSIQQQEFDSEKDGYSAIKHQREVGTGYFDMVSQTISGGTASTLAWANSTEAAQFEAAQPEIA